MINKNDELVCKGSLQLGSGCGRCSRCKTEIKSVFSKIKDLEERNVSLEHRWNSSIMAQKEREHDRTVKALEVAEAQIAGLETESKERESRLEGVIAKQEAELAAIRGASVPVAWAGMPFSFEELEKMHGATFAIGYVRGWARKCESVTMKGPVFTHPAPPVVVLPSADHEADGGYKYYRHETILKTLCANGITVKSADGEGD